MIGTIDIMEEAIPTEVYFMERRERKTPIKGPKKAPSPIKAIVLLLETASYTFPHLRVRNIIRTNPIPPAIILMWVAAKAL